MATLTRHRDQFSRSQHSPLRSLVMVRHGTSVVDRWSNLKGSRQNRLNLLAIHAVSSKTCRLRWFRLMRPISNSVLKSQRIFVGSIAKPTSSLR